MNPSKCNRVVINSEGEAISPARAKRDHNIEPAVIFTRNDGWTLGAPAHLRLVAQRLWADSWVSIAEAPAWVDMPLSRHAWHAGIGLAQAFIERIEFLANRAALTPAEVYAMWRKYAQQCDWADQSAILSEFEDWNKEALAPAAKLTISPELARQVATAESICLGKPLDKTALKEQTERIIREFNEADCGGAFDGNQVTSDADPGL